MFVPQRQVVLCSSITPNTKSTTVKSFIEAKSFIMRSSKMGAMMESGRKRRNPMIGCQLKTTAKAIILLDVVAMKTGA